MYTRKSQELMCSYDISSQPACVAGPSPDPRLGLGLNFLLFQMKVTTYIVVR